MVEGLNDFKITQTSSKFQVAETSKLLNNAPVTRVILK